MKPLGLQKSQFLNYLVNWEKSGIATAAYTQKNYFFSSFSWSPARPTFKNPKISLLIAEAATRGVLEEKMFIEILQNSQENNCGRVSF